MFGNAPVAGVVPHSLPMNMNNDIVDGRAIGRQQLLQLLRDVCNNAIALCERDLINSSQWPSRARLTINSCATMQRGVLGSYPKLADELHILATEIHIAVAAKEHDDLFASRIQKIREAIRRVQQVGFESDRPSPPPPPQE